MKKKVALFLDGGFVKKKLWSVKKAPALANDIVDFCKSIMKKDQLKDEELFRIYYYDAPPYEAMVVNPVDKAKLNLAQTAQASAGKALLQTLEMQPFFAIRRGVTAVAGWRLARNVLTDLINSQRPIQAADVEPAIQQKGVDMRIGLDIAWIATKQIVDILVLCTGDADFIPAMKLARKEGLLVYLETMGHGVRRELKVHADVLL